MNCVIAAGNLKVFGRAIQLLAKIPGEELYFDATDDGLHLRTLNASRSAFGCFIFNPQFFVSYVLGKNPQPNTVINDESDVTSENRCKIPIKSALMMFKHISNLEKSIDLCKLMIDVDKCCLVFQLCCKYGVVRTNNFVLFPCESMETYHDRTKCKIKIIAPGAVLVDGVMTNFKGGQEDVTLSVTTRDMTLKNCVDDEPEPEKCVKSQLRYDAEEFEQFNVNECTCVTFCLKELRALLSFVETFRVSVSIYFDEPGKPIIFALEGDPNFTAELILASYIMQDDQSQSQQQVITANSNNSITNETQTSTISKNSARNSVNRQISNQTQSNGKSRTAKASTALSQINSSASVHPSTSHRSHAAEINSEADTVNVDDVLPPSPQPKRARSYLFDGWSQKTMASTTVSQMVIDNDDDNVLAPDSDMEDY